MFITDIINKTRDITPLPLRGNTGHGPLTRSSPGVVLGERSPDQRIHPSPLSPGQDHDRMSSSPHLTGKTSRGCTLPIPFLPPFTCHRGGTRLRCTRLPSPLHFSHQDRDRTYPTQPHIPLSLPASSPSPSPDYPPLPHCMIPLSLPASSPPLPALPPLPPRITPLIHPASPPPLSLAASFPSPSRHHSPRPPRIIPLSLPAVPTSLLLPTWIITFLYALR